ncbi:MAG: hypothetical protein LQ338_005845 [Usnochroma carphineum]|nr:MAG: hypothetical protein LQ338_005845 [Usnochroma carphineum]
MEPQDLAVSLQALRVDSSEEDHHVSKRPSFMSSYTQSSTNTHSNEVAPGPATSSLVGSSGPYSASTLNLPNDWVTVSLAHLSLYAKEFDPSSLCIESDCPISYCIHYKGRFVHDPTPGYPVEYHEDFGYSDPPPFLWAAYLRVTQCFEELETNSRSAEDFIDTLMENPWRDPDHADEEMVRTFLEYHAVTLRQVDGRAELVPLRGRIMSGEDPEMLNGMGSLTL